MIKMTIWAHFLIYIIILSCVLSLVCYLAVHDKFRLFLVFVIANCFGCINNGSVDMMHPSDVGYAGGHAMNTYQPFSGPRVMPGSYEEESYEAEEARLRSTLQCLDDPEMMEGPPKPSKFWDSLVKVYTGPPGYSDRDRVPPGFPGSGHSAPPAPPAQYFGVGSGATQCFAPPGLSGLSSS
uniref:Uncharacterized protein n=1 Tax=Aegilops tauschii subsp. strangulata TaxID=200361 RepID=A0A453JHB7_AEGTS